MDKMIGASRLLGTYPEWREGPNTPRLSGECGRMYLVGGGQQRCRKTEQRDVDDEGSSGRTVTILYVWMMCMWSKGDQRKNECVCVKEIGLLSDEEGECRRGVV